MVADVPVATVATATRKKEVSGAFLTSFPATEDNTHTQYSSHTFER